MLFWFAKIKQKKSLLAKFYLKQFLGLFVKFDLS
ncbi:hypothetical protein FPSM_00901 [Flavobacterium psychrophilum]|nr:hypothetical protein FPSM_00901 [Flavobacterium psychrophilum]